jgi:hypothetical protein
MKTNNIFDVQRLFLLFRRQLSLSWKHVLLVFGAISGVAILIFSFSIFQHGTADFPISFMSTVLSMFFITGLGFTSAIFNELNSPQRGFLYLMLPATALEKLTIAWFMSAFIYLLLWITTIITLNIILIMINALLIHQPGLTFVNFFVPQYLYVFVVYLVVQPIFLLGSIYFRKTNFFKTILALFVVGLAFAIYTGIVLKLITHFPQEGVNVHFNNEDMNLFTTKYIVPVAKFLFWGCTAPFFLIITYFRLKERQIQ